MIASWQESYDKPRQCIKKQRQQFVTMVPIVKPMVFPVLMYRRESWTITELKNRLDYGQFHLCSGKIPWRREWLPTPVFRPGEFHGLYSPWVQSRVLGCNLKNDRMMSVRLQVKPFNIMVIQVYAPAVTLKKLKLNGSMKIYKTF